MANINKQEIGYNEVIAAGTANALMVQYKRANAAPLDITDVFTSKEYALQYAASGSTSYAGQVIAVAGENIETKVYKITSGGTLVELIDENALAEVIELAGKIDEIKVNGSALTITDKSVNIDLTKYATKDWVSLEIVSAVTEGKVNLEGYATEQWVEDKGYITANDSSITEKATKSEVSAITKTISDLIGEDTNMSIRQIAENEVSAIVGEAPEAFDTLKEIADWISSDSAGTEALINRVSDIENAVSGLTEDSHTHENKDVLDGITSEKVADWDAAEANASAYTDSAIAGLNLAETYEAKGTAQDIVDGLNLAETYEAKGTAQDIVDGLNLAETYEAKGTAQDIINGLNLTETYEAKGTAQDIVDGLNLAETYEAKGVAQTYADGLVSGLTNVVNTLIGEDNGKSVRTVANEEVAKVIGEAPEAFDTLKEIADWISSDSAGTEALINRVAVVESGITEMNTIIESLSNSSHTHENKDVLDEITAEKVAAWDDAVSDSHTHTNKNVLDTIDSTKVAAWDAAEAKASAYTDSAIAGLNLAETYEAKGAAESALTEAKLYVDEKVVSYDGGVAVNVDADNKINVLVEESTKDVTNWLKVKEGNTLAVNEIGLDDAVTTKDITIEGGEWATAVKKVFTDGKVPSGTSWQSFLESMLCVEKFAGTITTTDTFNVTCSAPGAGITGATNGKTAEVGTKVTLAAVSHKSTTANQSITSKTFSYGYKLGENGAYNSATAYTETLTPTLSATSTNLKETFTKFTDAQGNVLSAITGTDSLDAVIMYVNDGENKVVVAQTGDTYVSSSAVTAGTIYVATNLKNYYKNDKETPNTYVPAAAIQTKTATNSSTYTVTGYRNTFYGTTSDLSTCDASFVRSLTKSGKAIANGNTLSITTNASDNHMRMVIASPRTIKSVKNKTATQDITQLLLNTHTTLEVPGDNSYSPISYNVYDNTWKEAFGSDEWIITFN